MNNRKLNPDRCVEKIVSTVLPDEGIVELVHDKGTDKTAFAISDGDDVRVVAKLEIDEKTLIPVPATNNLIKHQAVLLPEGVDNSGSVDELIDAIKQYLNAYVDLSEDFCTLASYYVLLTWVYDAFNELPYLRFRGDYGSGKSRALTVVGSLAYKGFFASGASTVSPIFHTLDLFRGTLIIDEADFRFSDEKSELVKIFNNGNVRGFLVLRTAITLKKEFDPRAFSVFGPKIVAMRGSFEDQALESRFLTEEMGQRPLRSGIPINLPDKQKVEAAGLRNRLLDYRFRQFQRLQVKASLVNAKLSARMNQILVPLLSVIENETDRATVERAVQQFDGRLAADRMETPEAGLLEVLLFLFNDETVARVSVAAVTTEFTKRFRAEYDRPITNRFVGGVLRKRLRLFTFKSHGVYVIPNTERDKIQELAIRYGVIPRSPSG